MCIKLNSKQLLVLYLILVQGPWILLRDLELGAEVAGPSGTLCLVFHAWALISLPIQYAGHRGMPRLSRVMLRSRYFSKN